MRLMPYYAYHATLTPPMPPDVDAIAIDGVDYVSIRRELAIISAATYCCYMSIRALILRVGQAMPILLSTAMMLLCCARCC